MPEKLLPLSLESSMLINEQPRFEDIKQNGPAAFLRYMQDEELMRKVSRALGGPPAAAAAGEGTASEEGGAAGESLHDAARSGDVGKVWAANTF